MRKETHLHHLATPPVILMRHCFFLSPSLAPFYHTKIVFCYIQKKEEKSLSQQLGNIGKYIPYRYHAHICQKLYCNASILRVIVIFGYLCDKSYFKGNPYPMVLYNEKRSLNKTGTNMNNAGNGTASVATA